MGDEQPLPFALLQRVDQRRRRLQPGCVLVEQGQRIPDRTARRADTHTIDLFDLQGIQVRLQARMRPPHQRIEQVVGAAAGRYTAGAGNEGFVRLVGWQRGLIDESQWQIAHSIQGLDEGHTSGDILGKQLTDGAIRCKPRRTPINRRPIHR